MASTNKELIAFQRRMYFQLLSVKNDPKQLDYLLQQIKTEMDEEDAAYVEKQIRAHFGQSL